MELMQSRDHAWSSSPEVEAEADWTDGGAFVYRERVRYGDVDAMRHVGNVDFLRFFESARIAYVGALLPGYRPDEPELSGLVVAACHIDYRAPAYYGDTICTRIRAGDVSGRSFKAGFEMRRHDEDVLAEGYAVLVGYDYGTQRSKALSPELRRAITTHPGGTAAAARASMPDGV